MKINLANGKAKSTDKINIPGLLRGLRKGLKSLICYKGNTTRNHNTGRNKGIRGS